MKDKFTIPKGKYKGRPIDGMPDAERHHMMQCPGCGQMFDMRDLGEVFEHDGHDAPASDRGISA